MKTVFYYLTCKFCSSSNKFPNILCLHSSPQIPLTHSSLPKPQLKFFWQIIHFCSSMDQREEGKQPSQKAPSHNPVDSSDNIALENGLQVQSGTFTTFASLESGSESESSYNDHDEDSDFFLSQEFESELQFLESEGSNEDDDDDDEEEMEDEIDVDELTYEELIELGDFIGQEKRGLSANEICSCLHSHTYHSAESKSGINLCVICQVEYEEGEALVSLQCEHPYHTDCISKWLQMKKVCPICNTEISAPKMVS